MRENRNHRIVSASPAAQPGVFHAEKHCLDSFLVAQRPVVGFCERLDDHPAHSDVGGAEKFSVGHRVTMHNDPGRMDAIRDGNRKLFAGADIGDQGLLPHPPGQLAPALAVYRSVRSGMTPASSRILVGGRCCSVIRTPRSARASSTALVIAAGAPIMPPSPTPR